MNPRATDPYAFLPADSPTASEIRAFDWASTPLGPVEGWRPALKAMLATMLDTPRPMFMSVEPGQVFFFNDLYRSMLGRRLTHAVGKSFRELWPDVWDDVASTVERALDGEGTLHVDLPLRMTRHGFDEETWWTFSYAPLRDETGQVFGMYAITNETTRAVRTTQTLRELNASLEVEIDQRTRERD